MRSLRGEAAFTTVELAVASALSLVVLAALALTLVSASRTSAIGSSAAAVLDDTRLVLAQVERDLRGSRQFEDCTQTGEPAGSCVLVKVQSPGGSEDVVRYRVDGDALTREVDDGTGTFPVRRTMTDRLANGTTTPPSPVFACSQSGSLLRVAVNLLVRPATDGAPPSRLQTVVRPRNTYQPPVC